MKRRKRSHPQQPKQQEKQKRKKQQRKKAPYRVRNWPEYDRALVQRGSVTLWISDDAISGWLYDGPTHRGAPFVYSDAAIETVLTLREVYHLPNRGAEGFVRSLFQKMGIPLPVPDHTTLSRRGRTVRVYLPKRASGPLHLVLDSSGLKVYGEGEWKVRQHGLSKRRTWRKIHLGVDSESGEIQAVELTEAPVHDAKVVRPLLEEVDRPLASVAGDGSYDRREVYQALQEHSPGVRIAIPPRRDARIWRHGNQKGPPHPRDENLRYIRRHGRRAWKRHSGYHRRSLAETAVFRLKTIFGPVLGARLLETQRTQVRIRCRALNKMTHLGMPDSYAVT
ncbi:MAG: IS5 family transposase [Thermoflexales bacterium]|nr:IS5 family transposase [Thermoflexales bacterium]